MSPSFRAGLICTILTVIGVSSIVAQTPDSYCFRFTWLGPSYDNSSASEIANRTCKGMGIAPPCVEPLVFTFDGTEPDTDLMWETYDRSLFTCKLTRSTVCLKWVTYYDGVVEGITYMCGKMNGPSGAEKDKCETTKSGAYKTTACACKTPVISGEPRVPCNTSSRIAIDIWICLLFMTSALLALRGANSY